MFGGLRVLERGRLRVADTDQISVKYNDSLLNHDRPFEPERPLVCVTCMGIAECILQTPHH